MSGNMNSCFMAMIFDLRIAAVCHPQTVNCQKLTTSIQLAAVIDVASWLR